MHASTHPGQLLSSSRQANNICKPTQTHSTGTSIGQQGGFRLEAIHSLHLALSGTATLAIVVGLLFYCYIKRKKARCLGFSNQPPALPLTTPTAPPALQCPAPMPDMQLQQYPMNSLARMPNLQLNSNQQQSQLQNTIRVMVESELARTRNSNQQSQSPARNRRQPSFIWPN